MKKTAHLLALFLSACALAPAAAAQAQGYPEKSVTILVPYAAGGGADILARLLGQKLGPVWGQSVVVENRAGAGGSVGSAHAARATPDGYTLLMASPSHTINGALYKNLSFDAVKDFDPVVLVASGPLALVVPAQGSIQTLDDFVKQVQEPGAINFASAGVGSSPHLAGELFNQMAHAKMTHVPYKGTAPALTDLLANRVQVMFAPVPTVMPHLKSGALKVLAVTSLEPFAALPDVPALAQRFPGYEVLQWWGLVAPAGTPPAVVGKVNADVAAALRSPDVQERLAALGADAGGQPASHLGDLIKEEIPKWADVVKAANVQPE
ncbi:tripartite tricarboxylate transporter substrate binding protein [Bordetella sp. BOR01]|uniref:tripartite tricarboxylate transporter substrate binding protein n=1 Tax=Bordetella sp. BOR01 TaxID=2854779 RepID=UPI001C455768|nr:tripartite tricarboxylate transporter substrate binding protein [Bordetella sp. BOR01]MBV7483374.1 tripartite tricarboxylate transporter substrate binding protein [Bordetella sp. BOR01]